MKTFEDIYNLTKLDESSLDTIGRLSDAPKKEIVSTLGNHLADTFGGVDGKTVVKALMMYTRPENKFHTNMKDCLEMLAGVMNVEVNDIIRATTKDNLLAGVLSIFNQKYLWTRSQNFESPFKRDFID